MANEATVVESGQIRDFTVLDSLSFEKGSIMKLLDPRTCSGSAATGEYFAGVAASEKVANDGRTNLGCHTEGVFDMKVSGVITAGQRVKISGANYVSLASSTDIGNGLDFGTALETATDAEVVEVLIK